MKHVTHELELTGSAPFHGALPPRHLGYVLEKIQPAVQAAVAMAFRNRSTTKGPIPKWLKQASDIRFLGFTDNRSTRLQFSAPRLDESAGKLYEQGELFSTRPAGEDSAFELLADSLADIAASNENSERFDRAMLKRVFDFRQSLSGPFSGLSIRSRRPTLVSITDEVIQTAKQLRINTPSPRRVRIVGKLDAISDSRQAFELLMDSGERARGILIAGEIAELATLFPKRILIFGLAHFRPSGQLLRVDADEFRAATLADDFFAKLPVPIATKRHRANGVDRERMSKGLKSIIGQWPGDETDQQIEAALRELG